MEPDKIVENAAKGSGFWDKFNHPVLGPFITAWMVCNWEILYRLVCGFHDHEVTIAKIKLEYLHLNNLYLSFWPFLATVLYVVLGPILANLYKHYVVRVEVKREFLDAKVKGQEPIPRSTYDQVMRERTDYEIAYRTISKNEANKGKIIIPNVDGKSSTAVDLLEYVRSTRQYEREYHRLSSEVSVLRSRLVVFEKDKLTANPEMKTKPV